MGTRLSAGALAALFLCTPALAEEAHRLASSKTLGVEIDAMGGERWCQQRLTLSIHSQDTSVYPTADFVDLIKKLGQVLETECPEARHADLSGLNASGELVFEGSASAPNGWAVVQSGGDPRSSSGTDWASMFKGWLKTILGWASALRP